MEYRLLEQLLGVTLIAVSLYFAFFSKRIKVKPSIPTQIVAGSLSGLMGGFFGMQGPPAVLYFVSSEARQESLPGHDANLFSDRQPDNDSGSRLQRLSHHACRHWISVWHWRCIGGQPHRSIRVPAHHATGLALHHLCIHRGKWNHVLIECRTMTEEKYVLNND